jgi:mannose-1-phosphate guanylyltransferase / mannose-6-phosphate isomerase
MAKDEAGNATHGDGKVMLADTKGSYVYSGHGCLALVGVENIVVVMTEDAVLVASRKHAESVKSVVEQIRANGEAQAPYHNRIYRPWGWYQIINRGDRYQVKCIMVKLAEFYRCRAIPTGRNIGWWSRARLRLPRMVRLI